MVASSSKEYFFNIVRVCTFTIFTMNRQLSFEEIKVLGLSALGGALEFYDFIVFVYLMNAIAEIFFPSSISPWLKQMQTISIFATGFLARPLGGILLAHFGDRLGRKRIFIVSISIISLSTMAIGLLPTYKTIGLAAPILLFVLRIVQGCAVGGEVPGSWIFVAEHVPSNRVGFACSCVSAGLNFGILLGSLIVGVMTRVFSWEMIIAGMWRIPFIIGGFFGVFSIFLRRWLQETPVFLEIQKRKTASKDTPIKEVLSNYRCEVGTMIWLTLVLTTFVIVINLMTPEMLRQQALYTSHQIFFATNLSNFNLVIGSVLAGYFVDTIGVRKTICRGVLMGGCFYCLLSIYGKISFPVLCGLYSAVGLFGGVVAAMPFVFVNLFPANIRFTGISFSYNISYAIFAGLLPIIVRILEQVHQCASMVLILFICMIGVIGSFFLKDNIMSRKFLA